MNEDVRDQGLRIRTLPVNVFDQASRFAIQSDPTGFFRWLIPGLEEALAFQGWLDTRTLPFPGETDRVCDTVAHLASDPASGLRWAVVTEFQTEPEPDMLDRLLEYVVRLRRGLRHGPDRREKFTVIAALVGLTGSPQSGTLEMMLPNLVVPSLRFSVVVRTLREERADSTLAEIAAGRLSRCILAWVSLMRGAGDRGIIDQWKQIADTEPDPRVKAAYSAIALVFAELTDRTEVWRTALEGWNMRESAIALEWKAEGRLEGERDALLRILRLKFQTAVPRDLADAIAALDSLAEFDIWFEAVIRSDSLEDVRAAISVAK